MTRDEWLASDDPAKMLAWVTGRAVAPGVRLSRPVAGDRKLRLFALAAVRLTDPDAEELRLAPQIEGLADRGAPESEYVAIDRLLSGAGEAWARHQALRPDTAGHRPALAALLREVVGDPCRVPPVLPRTEAVLSLARQIDVETDFPLMGLLHDALIDAGCEDEEALSHCLESRHVRGCWLIDLLLEKS